jgi:lipoprotein-releasing system permease protein
MTEMLPTAAAHGRRLVKLDDGAIVGDETERTYDIGLLSAIGWQPARILSMVLIAGVLLTAAGNTLGIGVGFGVLRLLARMPPVLGFLEPEVTRRLVLQVAAATLVMSVAGSLYPSWRAVCLNPADTPRRV